MWIYLTIFELWVLKGLLAKFFKIMSLNICTKVIKMTLCLYEYFNKKLNGKLNPSLTQTKKHNKASTFVRANGANRIVTDTYR